MSASRTVFRSLSCSAAAGLVWALSGAVLAGPVGYLQVDGWVDVQSEGSESSVRVTDNNYTVFSGDRLVTRSGSSVLVLDSGGAIGLGPSSGATVVLDESSQDLAIELETGTLLYSLPPRAGRFSVALSDFELESVSADGQSMTVDAAEAELAGMIEHLDDGHIKVSVRSGQIQVASNNGSRYMVNAGDQIGLLGESQESSRIDVQTADSSRLVLIEAPEQVGTGESFSVRWSTESLPADSYLTIAPKDSDPEAFESVASTTQGDVIEFQAPGDPGDYEIRFVDGSTGAINGFVYLQVVGERAVIPWYANSTVLAGTLGFVAGAGTTAWLICDCDDDDDDPVSP